LIVRHPSFLLICAVVALAAGSWGLYWMPQRMLLDAGLTGGWGTVAQYVISVAVLGPVALWRAARGRPIGLRHWACGLLLASGFILYANSFLVTDVVRALVFFYLAPIWATLIEVVFLKRTPGWPRAASIVLGLAGAWIAIGLDIGLPVPTRLGDWFGLIGGMLVAAGAARTEVEQPEGVFPLLFMVVIFGLAATLWQYPLLASSIGAIPSLEVALASLPLLLALSLLFVIPTTAIIIWSPARVGTGVFGILILSEVVVGVISAGLLTDEPFGWREVTGVSLIVLAGIVEAVSNRTAASVCEAQPSATDDPRPEFRM
jgi:drug/metabolite transporter (DMT)-like permease